VDSDTPNHGGPMPEELCLDLMPDEIERAITRAVVGKYGVDLARYEQAARLEWWNLSGEDKVRATVVLTLKT
jgi:hypothetical protein